MANFHTPYETERQGQIEFFDNYRIPYADNASILVDNTDGVYNGCILEFKLTINNPNRVLFQAIKYLSRMRIKGESVPATILLIDLNATTVYVYRSEVYRSAIQNVYTGAASKDNKGFETGSCEQMLNYSRMEDSETVRKLLKREKKDPEDMYMPVALDENCIVGWAERYYRENPKASKGDFLGDETGTAVRITGEIREPRHFKGLILPYKGATNEKFKYLMDCLNDRLSKKDLGAFYTPVPYAKKAAELVQKAVNRALAAGKKDYIILDRCAGTGNLEAALIGLCDRNGEMLISHCIVSTYEYYEYKVLLERIGDQVRSIIPPSEGNVVFESGHISNADAMSREYIENPLIRAYVDNPDCAVILYENPPYHDETTTLIKNQKRTGKTFSYVVEQMKEEISGVATNELTNQFIWSGFKYYLRQPADSYVVFSPIKYWKQYRLFEAEANDAFVFNRQYFHATPSAISCILWENGGMLPDEIVATAFDIANENILAVKRLTLKRVSQTASKLYSKIAFVPEEKIDFACGEDGYIYKGNPSVNCYINSDVIGYMNAKSFNLNPLSHGLTRLSLYHGHGCYLTKENYKSLLPLWVSKLIPLDHWYEKDVYATTSDGGDKYTHDPSFLKSCLLYTCLSNQNKCLSFTGSDGRYYRNELCFDTTHGDTCVSADLKKFEADPATKLDKDERELMDTWAKILEEAKKCTGYNDALTYGVYQITKELNTFHQEGTGRNKKNVSDYPKLNGDLITLRERLKAYYKSHITEKMFQYELLK